MPRTRLRPLAIAGAWAALSLSPVLAQNKPPTNALASPSAESRLIVPRRPAGSTGPTSGTGGWWLGTAGIAGALAVFGGASLASKRFLPSRDSGPIRVVGRAALSPRHSVHLLRVGDRVLILGTGPQGAPTTLGEVTDPAELARLAPRRTARPVATDGVAMARPAPSFDQRIGGEE
ncbi:FliO/MopB family protein [Tundrisphaera lichenicola]|uniref:FliO/MopB family protein n=1 Tax=Tundrisphaera lichenicola TaxID=2029860 RepID=UPI003EBE4EAE